MSPDPYMASGGPSDPGSWNRYAYTRADPVSLYDPNGLLAVGYVCDAQYSSEECGLGGGASVGGGRGTGCDAGAFPFISRPHLCGVWSRAVWFNQTLWPDTPPELNCGAIFVPELADFPHYDILYWVLNENSYGLGAENLLEKDLWIVSVLQKRASTPGAGNLNNGEDSRNIDNQARHAGNPKSTTYTYNNLSSLIANKCNLAESDPGCQGFPDDIATAKQAIDQVLTTGSVNNSVFWRYKLGAPPSPLAGAAIKTIKNTRFYAR